MSDPERLLEHDPALLKIGEAATLTGISAGRIRHYQLRGLVRPGRSLSGYRYFGVDDLLRLLQIDLLRGLGMGLDEIRRSLPEPQRGDALQASLRQHRQTLASERDRLSRLLEAVDTALETPRATPEAIAALLAAANSTPRESLGIFGRLSRPLSEAAAGVYQELLGGGWGLPVPSIFGRLLLPAGVTELLEQLAQARGHRQLFERIRSLALEILQFSASSAAAGAAPADLARSWLRGLEIDPLPEEVQRSLDRTLPRIAGLDLLNQGFQLWASSISPPATEFLVELERQAASRHRVVLGVLVAESHRLAAHPRAHPRH